MPSLDPSRHYSVKDLDARDIEVAINGDKGVYVTECCVGDVITLPNGGIVDTLTGWAIIIPKPTTLCLDCGQDVETWFFERLRVEITKGKRCFDTSS